MHCCKRTCTKFYEKNFSFNRCYYSISITKKILVKIVKKINTLVVCGAESVDLANRLSAKFNSKRVLLMQGPDHYFTPEWENSKNFISAIQNFEYIITVSNFLSEIAQQMGAKNTICIPLGYDENVFKFEDNYFLTNKQQIKNLFDQHLEWLRPQDHLQRASVGFESAIKFMNSTDNTPLLDKFWTKTNELDDIRQENILEVIPELKALK